MAKTNSPSKLKLGVKMYMGCFIITTMIMVASYFNFGPDHSLNDNILSGGFILATAIAMGTWLVIVTTKQIEEVINRLGITSNEVMSASTSLAESSHSLAEGASEQSASVQETSATMEETSSLVQQTTQNTRQAVALAEHAKDAAASGVGSVDKLLESMNQLEKSSGEVQKIIKVIDEMAFQTNILSLNAAVEAARAGDAGKGFAVVAEEVRNLAQRSAQAARDTASLIDGNVNLTKNAVKVSEGVGSELKKIDISVTKVKELLDEISTASQEQVIAANQIAQAITQIDHVVQSQSAIAQTNASGADTLETYCARLKNVMMQLISIIKNPATANINARLEDSYMPKKLTSGHYEHRNTTIKRGNFSAAPSVNPEDVIPLDGF